MKLLSFICLNRWALIGMLIGAVVAYFYWMHYAIYWGTYSYSSEWWVNCIYGCLFGELTGCLFGELTGCLFSEQKEISG